MDRIILHSDCNCFYASVEMLHHPELAGKSLAVGGDPEARHGIVLTANYIAKRKGVKTGMALCNPEVLQKLRDILGTNYYILLSSTEEVWIMADTKDVDYETVMKTIPGADGSDVPKGILTGKLLYYDVEAGRIVTAREYKKQEGREVRQLA